MLSQVLKDFDFFTFRRTMAAFSRTWEIKCNLKFLPTRITKMHFAHSPNTPNKIKPKIKPSF
jgi:hypothetical protein